MREAMKNAWDIWMRFLGALWGAAAGSNMLILFFLMLIDFLTGLILAALQKGRKSESGGLGVKAVLTGILKKGMMLGVILLAGALDELAGQKAVFSRAALGFYICNEGISQMEHAALLGVPVPGIVKRALRQMHLQEKKA